MKTLQILFLSILCFSALGVGFIFIMNPTFPFGLSAALLSGTPFEDFFLPGLLLMVLVGGPCLISLIYQLQDKASAFSWTIFASGVFMVWLIIQLAIWSEHLLFQWGYMVICALLILISLQLRRKELI